MEIDLALNNEVEDFKEDYESIYLEIIKEGTVDFLSFSYYMSQVAAYNPEDYEGAGGGNLSLGI